MCFETNRYLAPKSTTNDSTKMIATGNPYQNPFRLADFFNAYWGKYASAPKRPIKPEHYKAVNAMRTCRTEVLGMDVYACECCGEMSVVLRSCKHRFCPTCAWKDTLKWAEKAYLKLLNIPHRHSVATVPHMLNDLIADNYVLLNNLLFRTAAETIKNWMNSEFNMTPGIMSVLHTFGERKQPHFHIHMIVSMGGINKMTGELITAGMKFIPYKEIANKFRDTFVERLTVLFDNNELKHDFENREEFISFTQKLKLTDWRFHFEEPMENALEVIKYIGRYSKRACLSEHKIVDIDGEFISFRYKDNMDKDENGKPIEKIETLHYSEFFPRLLQHVPPPRYQIIRYYGLYANSCKIEETHTAKPTVENQSCTGFKDPKFCEHCEQDKLHVYTVYDKRKQSERTEKFDINKHKNIIIDMQGIDGNRHRKTA